MLRRLSLRPDRAPPSAEELPPRTELEELAELLARPLLGRAEAARCKALMLKTKDGTESGNLMELELLLGQRATLSPHEAARVADLMRAVSPLERARAELQLLLSQPSATLPPTAASRVQALMAEISQGGFSSSSSSSSSSAVRRGSATAPVSSSAPRTAQAEAAELAAFLAGAGSLARHQAALGCASVGELIEADFSDAVLRAKGLTEGEVCEEKAHKT